MGVCPAERQLADGDNVMNLSTVPAVTSVLNVAASNGIVAFRPPASPAGSARTEQRSATNRRQCGSKTFLIGYYRRSEHDEHDLCDIPVPKTAVPSPRPRDGIRGGGTGRPHRTVARQSHLLVHLAQRVAAPAATRPLYRPRPDRHGRL